MPPKSQTIWDYGILNAQIKFGTALLKNSQIPNVDQFSCPTNKYPEFVRVIYDPFIMLDAYWTEEQVEGSDLHLGCTN